MGHLALASAVKDLALPEHVVRAVVADYLDFMQERQPSKFAKLDARLREEQDLHDKLYFEAQSSMLAVTLMLTIESSVDVGTLLLDVYGKVSDLDLIDMRRELVSRALRQAKDAASNSGLSMSIVQERKDRFCA